MKGIVLVSVLFLGAVSVFAQEETLIEKELTYGGFGAPVVRFTEVRDELGIMVGGRGGVVVNHLFSIGGGGYGLANGVDAGVSVPDTLELEMGYGGLELEWIGFSDRLVHLTFYTLLGAGGVSFRTADDDGVDEFDTDTIYVAEPIANIEVNVTKFFRMNAGAGYRFVWDVDAPGLEDDDLGGVTASLTFKFGRF